MRERSGSPAIVWYGLVGAMVIAFTQWTALPSRAQSRDSRSGLYAIWYRRSAEQFLSQPYIKGGQIVVQWANVEPQEGQYDFSAIDTQLADFAQRGQFTTLQVNGNVKPAWLFKKVPHVAKRLSIQVNDPGGTLMYWHPVHRDAYLAMLRNLADHLKRTGTDKALLGIRMNLNALGTEHHHVPPEFASPDKWTVPKTVKPSTLVPWTKKVDDAYVQAVVDTYIESFRGVIRIFVRNNISDDIVKNYRKDFTNGTLSWFHTSSEVEPRATFAEKKYQRFYDDCRSGHTTAYAEPWASAWGHHGGKTDDRWCSPPQWNYWRLLFDLHCGVSYIALYSSDMRVAIEGRYDAAGVHFVDTDRQYQTEFLAAFQFAAKYAGLHASPALAPGAWVALRENHFVRAANGIPKKRRKLSIFTGDYNFMMRRLPGDKSRGSEVVNIGPDEQRFGAWARILPAGQTMRFELDHDFATSLANNDIVIRIVCLDDSDDSFDVVAGDRRIRQALTNTKQWREFTVETSGASLAGSPSPAQITITAHDTPIYLHMIEVQRSGLDK